MLANPITSHCTTTFCATVNALHQSCSVPLVRVLIKWNKPPFPLPYPLLHCQSPFFSYYLQPSSGLLLRSYSGLSIFSIINHLHQNFIFYLVSGKPLVHLYTGVSHWWWVMSLLVAAKPAVGSCCAPCRGASPESRSPEGLAPTTLPDDCICHLCLTPIPDRGTETNTSICLRLCSGNIFFLK